VIYFFVIRVKQARKGMSLAAFACIRGQGLDAAMAQLQQDLPECEIKPVLTLPDGFSQSLSIPDATGWSIVSRR